MRHQSKVKRLNSDITGTIEQGKANAEAEANEPETTNSEATNAESGPTHERQMKNLSMSKKNYWFVYGLPQAKILRHLQIHSNTHAEIAH